MEASVTLAQRAIEVQAQGCLEEGFDGVVASPCIGVCRMTPDRSHCQGCLRTLAELRAWRDADAAQRRVIWGQLLARAGLPQPAPLDGSLQQPAPRS